jgi:glycerophosphoryl diester phosphodiesterase
VTVRTTAHRGFAGYYPENTVRAVRAATDGRDHPPADTVEVDVQPTAGGDPVVIHDPELDGLTDREGLVRETPTAEVCAAEVLDSGATVPRLAAIVEAVPDGVVLNVELKPPDGDARPDQRLGDDDLAARRTAWEPLVRRVLDALEGRRDVLLSSFCEAPLSLVAELSDRPTAGITVTPETGLAVARAHGCEAVHAELHTVPGTGLGDGSDANPGLEPDLLAAAADAGLAVRAWTVRTWYEAARLREAGVDGLIADYPGL